MHIKQKKKILIRRQIMLISLKKHGGLGLAGPDRGSCVQMRDVLGLTLHRVNIFLLFQGCSRVTSVQFVYVLLNGFLMLSTLLTRATYTQRRRWKRERETESD